MKPPNVEDSWDDCNVIIQARMIAYSQIRELEESESFTTFAKMFS